MCVLCLLVWEIKRNLKSVIMVVGKAGREGALILQVDGDFFPPLALRALLNSYSLWLCNLPLQENNLL